MASNPQTVKNYFSRLGAKVGSNIFWEDDIIYSYGHHFPLCIRLDSGQYIINADKYSTTTNKHTSICISNAPKNTPCIPFSSIARIHQKENIQESETDMIKRIKLIEVGKPFYTPRIKHLDKIRYEWKEISENILNAGWKLIKETNTKIVVTVPVHHLGYTLFGYNDKNYISGMDDKHYFLCELIGNHKDIESALRSMASNLNDSEYKQYKDGTIKRQGEFFFIPVEGISEKALKETIKLKQPIPQAQGSESHIADKMLRFSNSDKVYVRGRIKHSRGDHRSLVLNDWHIVVSNTVKESWTSNGRVD